jgi:hypothetical protein
LVGWVFSFWKLLLWQMSWMQPRPSPSRDQLKILHFCCLFQLADCRLEVRKCHLEDEGLEPNVSHPRNDQ